MVTESFYIAVLAAFEYKQNYGLCDTDESQILPCLDSDRLVFYWDGEITNAKYVSQITQDLDKQ